MIKTNMIGTDWLEALNGLAFIQSVQLCVLFAFFLWRFRHDYGQPYYNLTAAIATYHTGAAFSWGWRWVWRWLVNNEHPQAAWVLSHWEIPLVGGIIMCVGLLCKIRVVTYSGWGHWPWILSLMFSLIFVLVL